MFREKFTINLQLHADGDAPDGFFKFKDPEANKEILIPQKIKVGEQEIDMQVIVGHLNSGVRKYVKQELEEKNKKKFDELTEMMKKKDLTLAEVQKKIQEYEDEKLTADERVKKEIERERNKFQTDLKKTTDDALAWQNRFKDTTIDNAILSALPGNVYNPSQTMLLIKNLMKPEVVQTENGFSTVLSITIDGAEQKLAPKEAIEMFLALPGNEHHLKNNLVPGAGSSSSGGRMTKGGLVYKRSDIANNPKIREEYSQKLKAGEAVSIGE